MSLVPPPFFLWFGGTTKTFFAVRVALGLGCVMLVLSKSPTLGRDTIMSEILTAEKKQTVYNAYRLALRANRRNANGSSCRAAERRNNARKAVVVRYNVSFQDVKSIVAEYDALNGVTHEHSPAYLLQQEWKKAQEAVTPEMLSECAKCGSTESVRLRANPVRWAEGKLETFVACYTCYRPLIWN